MVERRWYPRRSLRTRVALCYGGIGILRGTTRDISAEGIYIETPPVRVPVNAAVEVVFSLDGNAAHRLRLPALVVRSDEGGIGAMFRRLDVRAADLLRSVSQVQAAQAVRTTSA